MAIAQIQSSVASASGCPEGCGISWTRSLVVSSLMTGAILLACGKRKAGLAVAASGAAVAFLEAPEEVVAVWKNLPSYIRSGRRLLDEAENLVKDLAQQGRELKTLLERPE